MTYLRNGRVPQKNEESPANEAAVKSGAGAEQKIKVDGFGQVIAMLRHADPEFRQSLLRRLTKQDPQMGASLQAALRKAERENS